MLAETHRKDRSLDWSEPRASKELLDKDDKYPLCYVPFDLSEEESFKIALRRAPKSKPRNKRKISKNPIIAMVTNNGRSHSAGFSLEPFFNLGVLHYQLPLNLKEVILRDKVDILIDCTRHLDCWPIEIFAERLAPVQISGFGYGGSSGCDFFDYFLTDKMMTPDSELNFFTEKLIFLDHYHPIEKLNVKKKTKHDFGFPLDTKLFGYFGATYKISPVIFDGWMETLRSEENSTLWILPETELAKEHILHEANERGVKPSRIKFATKLPPSDHLERISVLDLLFDCPRLGGGSGILDALALGVPVKTVPGTAFSSRSGESSLASIGNRMDSTHWAKHVLEKLIHTIIKPDSSHS